MQSENNGYLLPVLLSVIIHGMIIAAVGWGWQSNPQERKVMPRYIEAKLIKVTPKTQLTAKPKKKTRKIDLTKKRREAEKRKAAEKKQLALKAKKEKERKQKEDAKRKKQQELEQQLAEEKLRQEFAEELAEEEAILQAEQDEATAQGFVALIANRVENNWSRPPSARKGMQCELQLQLVPTGQVINVTVTKGSGNAAFDRSARQAVLKVDRFPELQNVPPEVFEKFFRQLTLVFNPKDLRL